MNANPNSIHALVGIWTEKENRFHTSSVVYTISARNGDVLVSGVDESDGVAFKVSDISWDGEKLRFKGFHFSRSVAQDAFKLVLCRLSQAGQQVGVLVFAREIEGCEAFFRLRVAVSTGLQQEVDHCGIAEVD
jgi:hypothetical protein